MQVVLNKTQIDQKIMRLAHQILENSLDEKTIFIAGIIGNGVRIAKELGRIIQENSDHQVSVLEIKMNKEQPLQEDITISIDPNLLLDIYRHL